MRHFNSAFGEIARESEILPLFATALAMIMGTGPTHGRNDEVAFLQIAHFRPHLHHFSQRFMPNYKVIEAIWGRAVNKMTNLLVRSANAHFQRADFHMVIGGNVGRVVIDKSHFLFGRRYTYRSHSRSIHSEKAAPLAFESVRGKQVSRNWPLENKNLVYACDRL